MSVKTIYTITHDGKDVEDLTNDVFIKLIEKTPLIRTLSCHKTAAYVVYTARSVAINFIRHRDVQSKYAYFGSDMDLAEDLPDQSDTVLDRFIRQDEMDDLNSAILKLPEKQKDLLYFKYILQMSDESIAKSINITPDSVRQYLTRARRQVRKLMEKEMSAHAE